MTPEDTDPTAEQPDEPDIQSDQSNKDALESSEKPGGMDNRWPAVAYDDLDPAEQALARETMDKSIAKTLQELNLEDEFRAEDRSWTELDEHGNVIRRP